MDPLSSPKELAERGEKIYLEKYKAEFETRYPGKFVAIDVGTAKTYVADTPEEAVQQARKDSPKGFFHLIKVGATGAFRVSYTNNAALDWIFR